jgi:hypothetical protein
MFILFNGILINQNTVSEIKRVVVDVNKTPSERPWTIELTRAMQPPVFETFLTKDDMNRRWEIVKDKCGCPYEK